MDCRDFRDKHALLIDVRCSALEENEMRDHMRECPACSRHDLLVRRSLLLVRNLPTIEPSPDFRHRLDARLRTLGPAMPLAASRPATSWWRVPAAAAAGIAVVTYLAYDMVRRAPAEPIELPPVVASAPAPDPSPVASPALVAAVPTGMSVWPAIMVASQAPIHFVAAELASER